MREPWPLGAQLGLQLPQGLVVRALRTSTEPGDSSRARSWASVRPKPGKPQSAPRCAPGPCLAPTLPPCLYLRAGAAAVTRQGARRPRRKAEAAPGEGRGLREREPKESAGSLSPWPQAVEGGDCKIKARRH